MNERVVNETITAQVRFSAGHVHPVAFTWRGRTRYLAGLGRQWHEESTDGSWHCFLAQTTSGDTVELRWNQHSNEWRLHRAWQHTNLA